MTRRMTVPRMMTRLRQLQVSGRETVLRVQVEVLTVWVEVLQL